MTQQASAGRAGTGTPRRTVVAAAGAAGLAAALAACGNDADGYGGSASSAAPETSPGSSSPAGGGGAEDGGGTGAGGAAGGVLAKVTDIPEGGGKVFKDHKIVVTQPAAGEFKAFSAVCRHQGCLVDEVAGGTINCPCHGSKYAVADGSVRKGPATQGLPAAKVSVEGDSIKLG
ncbi:Rieske (2Fe-2S) protein [Streptomyces sp. NPDC007100]|uniref:Rieske (2Fe-2S) protein n=1 Tax=Streptomyces sp. NPDC007100 TaxID=3155602 RepID=UPI0033FB46E4